MPIISIPENSVPAKCKINPPYRVGKPETYYCTIYENYESQYPTNTIWQCPDCGEYRFTSRGRGSGGWKYWIPVRWYHFSLRKEIDRVERETKSAGGVL